MGRVDHVRLAAAALAMALAAGAATAGDARARLSRIPRADRARHAEAWQRSWRNPRVLVDRDAVYLLVGGRPFDEDARPVEDVAAALAALPRRAWPDGRIVALTRTARLTDEERLARVRALLEELGVEAIETPVGCNCSNE